MPRREGGPSRGLRARDSERVNHWQMPDAREEPQQEAQRTNALPEPWVCVAGPTHLFEEAGVRFSNRVPHGRARCILSVKLRAAIDCRRASSDRPTTVTT